MKANLLRRSLLIATAVVIGTVASAQASWKTHTAAPHALPEVATKAATGNTLSLGYTLGNNATIYPYDGYSFNADMHIGAAALFTKSMLQRYAGGKIVALNLGWNDMKSVSEYEGFITKGINGELVASCSGAVKFGWNSLSLDNPYTIPEEPEELFVGFYTDVKQGVYCIPTCFPEKVPNSTFLWDGETRDGDGQPVWFDFSLQDRPLAIQIVIEDVNGTFANVVGVSSLMVEKVVEADKTGTAAMMITNWGTNNIASIEVTTLGLGQAKSVEMNLSSAIPFGYTTKVSVPLHCFGTGVHSVAITKINGEENPDIESYEVNLLGVPEAVARQYTMRPLMEYFVSENNYKTPKYTDEYLLPTLVGIEDDITLVCQHTDDQFMTGDDDAIAMLLKFMSNDSLTVEVPCMMLNRAYYNTNVVASDKGPEFPVLLGEYATNFYKDVLTRPTFASIGISAALDEAKENVSINVEGHIAENVLPADEPLYLTAYLMEKDVASDSQIFWDEKEKGEYEAEYVHKNVIRQILTPLYGEQLESNSGDYALALEAEIDEMWNADNLYVVAFLNRGIAKGSHDAQVINSAEAGIEGTSTAIGDVNAGKAPAVSVQNGSISAGGNSFEVYTADGRRVQGSRLPAGSYIVKVDAGGKQAVRKLLVK